MNQAIALEELKEFVSNWSAKMINGQQFDQQFKIGSFPLSWFYRPILYSSLLPKPFPTTADLLKNQETPLIKLKLWSGLFKNCLRANEHLKSVLRKHKSGQPPSSGNPKVLFLTFTNHISDDQNLFRINKIVEKMKQEKKYEPFLLVVDPLSRLSVKKIRGCGKALYDYYDEAIKIKSRNESLRLSQAWKILSQDHKRAMLRYQGRDLFTGMRLSLDFLYSREFMEQTIKFYFTFRKIIELENIKAVVLSSQNNIFEKGLIAASADKNIPVVVIQHGIGLGTLRTIDTPENVKFAVFGNRYKEELIKLKVKPDNIQVTGPIILDEIDKYIQRKANSGREILIATSPFIEDNFLEKGQYFARVRKIIQELSAVSPSLVFKLHPREIHQKEYQKIVEELGINAVITNQVDREKHYQLITDCDLLVTFGSTVALEGMIIGKPTLTVDLFDSLNPTNMLIINSGATTVAKYNQNLAILAKGLLVHDPYQEQAKEFVESLCYILDGKASQRIVNYIYQEIAGNGITFSVQA